MDGGVEASGERMEGLLARLAELPDPRALEWAECLVRAVTDLYGEGLARLVEAGGPDYLVRVARDELVGSLLMLHGLHPKGMRERVEEALAGLPGLLGFEDVRVVDADEDAGMVRVRVLLAPGRAKQRELLEKVVRDAVEQAAPDVVRVVLDTPDPGVPVILGTARTRVATAQ